MSFPSRSTWNTPELPEGTPLRGPENIEHLDLVSVESVDYISSLRLVRALAGFAVRLCRSIKPI
jgi:hypothetical protein